MRLNEALVIVDVQNDFLPGGALSVPNSDEIIPKIIKVIETNIFRNIVCTLDCHPFNHCSFIPFDGIWPEHCITGTRGARLEASLENKLQGLEKTFSYDPYNILYYKKGEKVLVDSYSPFYDANRTKSDFDDILKASNIDTLYVCGIATEYCVKSTVLDALQNKYNVYVLIDCIAGLSKEGIESSLTEFKTNGAQLILSSQMPCQKTNLLGF